MHEGAPLACQVLMKLLLSVLPGRLAICRLEPCAPVPDWAWNGSLAGVTRTRNELSIVCDEQCVPSGVRCERGWRALEVAGPLDFGLTGVLARLAVALAEAGISIFAVSTFDTDYVLVQEHHLEDALQALESAGCELQRGHEL